MLQLFDYGPVHTNPFSNVKGAVLLRFQKDLRPHLSFSYRFRPSTLQRRIRFENAFIPSVRIVAFVRHFGYSRSSGLATGLVYFDDITVFRKHRFLRPH